VGKLFDKLQARIANESKRKRDWTATCERGQDFGFLTIRNKSEPEANQIATAWRNRDFPGGLLSLHALDDSSFSVEFGDDND